MAFLILLERLFTYAEPWFTDLVFYSTVGNELLHGRSLYSDLWDLKPPATYATFALAEAVFGHTSYLLVWLGFLAATGTLLGLYAAGKAVCGSPEGGLWAGGFWCLLATDLYLEGSQVNCEAFINFFLVGSIALLLWRWKKDLPPLWAFALIGFSWALVSLYKQFMAIEAIVIGLAYAWTAPSGKERIRAIQGVGLAWGTATVIWVIVFWYFYATGRGPIFYDTLFTYGRFYSGDLLSNFAQALGPKYFLPGWFWYFLPMGLLSLAAAAMAWRKERRVAAVFLAFLVIKFFEKAMPGRLFRHHYYQLWVPALCLGTAWALWQIGQKYSPKAKWSLGGVLLLALGVFEAHSFALSPMDWSQECYGLDYVGVGQTVEEVNRVLQPGEEFYEWAEFPRFYYACGRQTPTGILYGMHLFNSDPLSGGFFASEFTQHTLADLERNQPELVIWDKQWQPDGWRQNPVAQYLMAHYRPFAACGLRGRFELQCLIGGKLEQRLKAGSGQPTGPESDRKG